MFNNEEETRKWLKEHYGKVEYTDEELKKIFIENFGEQRWQEMEEEAPLMDLAWRLCEFLGIEIVPIIFEDMDEDGRYYPDEDYIAISTKFLGNEEEQIKSLIHEVKHVHQRYVLTHQDEETRFAPKKLVDQWRENYKLDIHSLPYEEQMGLAVEIDAVAFMKYILREWFGKEWKAGDFFYEFVLEKHIEKYFK